LFPTRYALELEGLKGVVTHDTFKEPSQRENAKKTIKKLFEDRYTTGKNKWFFQSLRVSYFLAWLLTSLTEYLLAVLSIFHVFVIFFSPDNLSMFDAWIMPSQIPMSA
jgi:hypothetical protein